jgi:hypothetical protein
MGNVYVGDTGLAINIEFPNDNLASLANPKLHVIKPNRERVEWIPDINTSGTTHKLVYITQDGDLNCAGKYFIRPAGTIGTWSGSGDPVVLEVKARDRLP